MSSPDPITIISYESPWTRFAGTLKVYALNYCCAVSLLACGFLFYTQHPYFEKIFSKTHDLHWFVLPDKQLMAGYFWLCVIGLLPFYWTMPAASTPKSRLVWRAIFNFYRRWPTPAEKTAILATLIKLFFLPLVLIWLVEHSASIIFNAQVFYENGNFFPYGFWLILYLILWVDVFVFTLSYTIEHPRLGNEIRSVDTTILGWFTMLICYPPFNGVTNQIFGWYSSNYPDFTSLWGQYIGALLILLLMGIYAWASIALGLRASNLSNRGIIARGPYAYVRHPAYITKNIAWWVGVIPALMTGWNSSVAQFCYVLAGMTTWTFVYYLRAMCEEKHLSADPEYRNYCQLVRFRFIPGIY